MYAMERQHTQTRKKKKKKKIMDKNREGKRRNGLEVIVYSEGFADQFVIGPSPPLVMHEKIRKRKKKNAEAMLLPQMQIRFGRRVIPPLSALRYRRNRLLSFLPFFVSKI